MTDIALVPPANPDLLTWAAIASLGADITAEDLIAYQAQKAGMAATISQAVLHADERSHGVALVVVSGAVGVLCGHLFLPRADGEPLSRKQLATCGLIGAIAFSGAILGTTKLYQRR